MAEARLSLRMINGKMIIDSDEIVAQNVLFIEFPFNYKGITIHVDEAGNVVN